MQRRTKVFPLVLRTEPNMRTALLIAWMLVCSASQVLGETRARVIAVDPSDSQHYLACLELRVSEREAPTVFIRGLIDSQRFSFTLAPDENRPTVESDNYFARWVKGGNGEQILYLYGKKASSTKVLALSIGDRCYPLFLDNIQYGDIVSRSEAECGPLRHRTQATQVWTRQSQRRALEATVRVHIPGAVGTGVIIETPAVYQQHLLPGEVLVATAAHVTPQHLKTNEVTIDLFTYLEDNSVRVRSSFAGRIIVSGESNSLDVGLLAFNPGTTSVARVPLADQSRWYSSKREYFVTGCPQGNEPRWGFTGTVRAWFDDKQVLVEKTSESGESGGGLFDSDGCLLGICASVYKRRVVLTHGVELLDSDGIRVEKEVQPSIFTHASEALLSSQMQAYLREQIDSDIEQVLLRVRPEERAQLRMALQRARLDAAR